MGRRVKKDYAHHIHFYSFQPYAITFSPFTSFTSLFVGAVLFSRSRLVSSNIHQQCFFNMHILSLAEPFAGIKSLFTEALYCYGAFIGLLFTGAFIS